MNCPYCSIEMNKCQIKGSGRSALTWKEEKEIETVNDMIQNFLTPYDEILSDGYIFGSTRIEGYRCDVCKKIIIDLEKEKREY